ncbi:MAG: DUF6125 family protein [Promethearchaeota archaeon]
MSKSNMETIVKDKYELPFETQKFLLQVCWVQHDGQWFLKTKDKFGKDVVNEINLKTTNSIGKIEAKHVLNALNIKKGSIKNIPELFKTINTFMDIFIPITNLSLFIHSFNKGVGRIKKCVAWDNVKNSKGEKDYECSCLYRYRGWMEAMGVSGEIITKKRLSDGDNECIFEFNLVRDS